MFILEDALIVSCSKWCQNHSNLLSSHGRHVNITDGRKFKNTRAIMFMSSSMEILQLVQMQLDAVTHAQRNCSPNLRTPVGISDIARLTPQLYFKERSRKFKLHNSKILLLLHFHCLEFSLPYLKFN
jgi:hypothetical protein